jgi:LAO/AO transport system kinase
MILPESILEGNRLALARLLTQVENDTFEGRQALNILYPHTGSAHLIGVTGAPGTGKSSLVNQLALYFRQAQHLSYPLSAGEPPAVAIVAVDPSSPFTGGAILGDRVRMHDLAGDPGVFIRSMASRGTLGGLASATAGVVQAFDAAGFELILIETVGAGQAEVDIARLAHTTLVVEAPGLGDDIQAIKAGILEIADILVVNKADRPGVEATERALRGMLRLAHPGRSDFVNQADLIHHHSLRDERAEVKMEINPELPDSDKESWIPPILRTIATTGIGVPELTAAIGDHLRYLHESGEWKFREKARLQSELDMLLQGTLVNQWRASISESRYDQVLQDVVGRKISPRQAVDFLLNGGAP